MTPPLLSVQELEAGYGESRVVQGVSVGVEPGEVAGIIGRNGVGKTTFVHAVMGMVRPAAGSVRLGGDELAGSRPHRIARAGIGLVPQGRRIFAPLTVEQNLRIAERNGRDGQWTRERIYELLPRLAERRANRGDQLSGGEQQMLAIGRALLGNPRLLLLDEPSDGLAPAVVRQVTDLIRDLSESGLAVVLVEQNLVMAVSLADTIHIMAKGRLEYSASTAQFRTEPEMARRFLGVG